MVEEFDLSRQARAIPKEERSRFLTECLETELHSYLASLFCRVEETAAAEVTHGPDEFGRDIVLRRRDAYGEQYIGVVVKRNPHHTLSGRSAGSIDEIISQAKQATVYPCQLKQISAENVTISGVWIAVFARMTSNAMVRLKSETADVPGIRILVLDALVELFSVYYPEVFFEGRVSEFLADKIIELENWRGISNRQLRLSESFVNPTVAEADAELDLMDEGLSFVFGNKKLPFAHLEEYINSNAKLLLTGDPGTGKSTALRKIAIDRLTQAHNTTMGFTSASKKRESSQRIPIPVLINAVQTRNGTTISDLIAAELPPHTVSDRFRVRTSNRMNSAFLGR